MSERSEIIQVLKEEGVLTPPQGERVGRSRVGTWFESLFAVLTPRRLALAGVSAAALLIAAWLLIPRTGTVPPPLILTGDETVRGATVEVVSPVKEVAEVPAFLEWKKAGEDFEYRVSLAGIAPLMSATTKDTRVVLPDEIKARMRPGQTYYWQVQAFKPDGTLVAASARIKFRIRAAH